MKNRNLLSFAALILFLVVAVASSNDSGSYDSLKYIKGLAPVDVYLNMEKQGFTTDRQIGGEYGNSWTSIKSYAGIDYEVETYSSNIDNVESVRGTAMIDVTQKK